MQLIPCPNCGRREEIEFHYGGQAHVPYPAEPAALGDTEWADYLFFRDNPKGPFAERWYHSGGCRRWFNAVRDTRSYRFLAVYQPDAPRPDMAQFTATVPVAVSAPAAATAPAAASATASATNAVTR